MESINLSQITILLIWVLIAFLTGVIFLIARFYQKNSGESTRYPLFLVPLLLFLAGTLRFASIGQMAGDALGGLLWFLGAVLQTLLVLMLYRQMTHGRR